MSHIVILAAATQAGPLTQAEAARAMDFCAGQHLTWLAAGEACEFIVKTPPDQAQLKLILTHKATDVLVTKFRGRRKALLVADMDSTIVTSETLDDLAELAGLGIAYRPKPIVAEKIKNRIEHTDLRSLLFAQGFPASAFKGNET
jgi:phosphoserine phosphatase